ncbi:hypothetical protein EST38_g3431 [Candolleomyces aberdarensis]|uniref:Uncharacterized protein n=1 Tax=Candolleomyces aberdarensis TaxID=2316362 RepID=A0A4Q2DS33_9AGAR|nr:hypothetical protein EST38_g3431 [Candolleomyces aberdarensis]
MISLPLISQYSFWTQFSILGILVFISYLHRTSRLVLATLTTCFVGLKILIPIFNLLLYLFKGIAWIGFYIYFFQHALTTAASWLTTFFEDGLPWFFNEIDKARAANVQEHEQQQEQQEWPGATVEEVD